MNGSSEENNHIERGGDENNDKAPYSRFGRRAKAFLSVICASCGLFSAIAAPIYYPALDTIKDEFHVSGELLNISVVVYFIFQGISPSVMGGFADSWGRRPVVIWCLAVYFAACVGLAQARTYGQILGLRCLQSAGISPVIALNSGLLGDVTLRHERGGYVGMTSGIQLIGSSFGALIGAGLTSRWDWRAVFWFLAIGSGFSLIVSSFLMPETNRSLAGNGSVLPKSVPSRAPILYLPAVKRSLHLDRPDLETLVTNKKITFMAPLKILAVPSVLVVLCVAGIQFAIYTCMLTELSSSLQNDYGLSVAKVGLCYLPSGICTLISVISTGRLLNWNYKRRLSQHRRMVENYHPEQKNERPGNSEHAEDLVKDGKKLKFNIYRVRLEIGVIPMIFSFGGYIAFGWCLYAKTHLAVVLFFSGLSALCSTGIVSCTNTLMVDLHPDKGSSASACLNLCRCLLAAALIAALDSMKAKMTVGGTFTFMVGVAVLFTTGLVYIVGSAMTKDTAPEDVYE
ncbi:LADA_0F15500g1_1 [Lachancea dasiensis]|uniref:LADA_0F15500g1_1 n=1 Tax=Lachancea dasiensis TaxID=1072105 RepID=A0A1G4JNR3_9SACH|nr:LADA_0F15500g1_1 [Lachancea dasiensis]